MPRVRKVKIDGRQLAEGRCNAPFLFVLSHKPTPGMEAWFHQKMLDCGINIADCRFVYMLDAPPRGSGTKILKGEQRESWGRFATEIRESTPKVVLPLGSDAVYALTGIHEHIFHARGYLIKKDLFRTAIHDEYIQVGTYKGKSKTGAKKGDPKLAWKEVAGEPLLGMDFDGYVIPMFQLDHIQSEGFSVSAAVNADLMRAARVLKGELHCIDDTFTYETSLSPRLLSHKWGEIIAVDIETEGVDNEVIDCVSISDGDVSCSIPWDTATCNYLSRLFALPDRVFALHNSFFDLPRLIKSGVRISHETIKKCVYDTMFGGVTLQPDLLKGLGAMATIYLDTYPWKWELISHADPTRYSAKDAYVTHHLAKAQIKFMKDLGTWNLFMGKGDHPGPGVMATLPMLNRSSLEGIRVDKDAVALWSHQLNRKLERLLKLWTHRFPNTDLSLTGLRHLFYSEWDLPHQKTRKDGLSTDELACMRLREYTKEFANSSDTADEGWRRDPRFYPRVFDLILAIRETSKNLSTYAVPALQSGELFVHPQYLPASKDREHSTYSDSKGNTATGRLVAYHPNIQNQPKRSRFLYVPDTPGMCFLEADYVRAEPHIMAYMAHDQNMIDDLRSGDLYKRLLERLTDMGYKGLKRKTCKNVFLAQQYLAGARKVSEMILKQDHVLVPVATCKEIMYGINTVYSDVAAYKKHLSMQCEHQRYIRNPFGRVRFFYTGRVPAAVDFVPQSTVGDSLWCVLLEVDEAARALGGRFTITVHDSILVQVPEASVEKMAREMRRIMCRTFDCVCPGFSIPINFKAAGLGQSWGHVKPYVLAEAA